VLKPTARLCTAVVLYHTERISKGVYSISKVDCELPIEGLTGAGDAVPCPPYSDVVELTVWTT